jgi:hypothetical protein
LIFNYKKQVKSLTFGKRAILTKKRVDFNQKRAVMIVKTGGMGRCACLLNLVSIQSLPATAGL